MIFVYGIYILYCIARFDTVHRDQRENQYINEVINSKDGWLKKEKIRKLIA